MHSMKWTWPLLALLVVAAPAHGQGLGTIAGQVLDAVNAITLPGVPVELTGPVSQIEYTDLDGNYRFQVPPGAYELKVVMGGYAEQTVTLDVEADQLTRVQVSLASNVFAETVTVSAPSLEAESSTAAAQLMLRMRAPVVQDNIGAIEMSANDDSNAADAMERVTGVSVVGSGSVFVRGLGERYSNTTLNGAMLPTTEPDRRVVPLDLFPTALIDSVQVSKTYTPDKPSQFAGGLVEIIPLKLPVETSWEIGAGGGWNSVTTGTRGLSYLGADVSGSVSMTARGRCRAASRTARSSAAGGSPTTSSASCRASSRSLDARSTTSGIRSPRTTRWIRATAGCSAAVSATWAS